MSQPTDREQVEFLTKLQRLLAEGEFVASYKYALLLALADIAVEKGDDSGAELRVAVDDIADRFIRLYWRQAAIHPRGAVLRQNTGRQAEIVTKIVDQRQRHGASLAALQDDTKAWRSIVAKVARVVRKMPLFRLQTLGSTRIEFLYGNVEVNGCIELRTGVAFCLRRFHRLVHDLVQSAWLGYVRRHSANLQLIGEETDLATFMFGTERDDLSALVPVLQDLQQDACFYCDTPLRGRKLAVDHFVPWALYPVDLGHNFVLVDERCNTAKRDTLAGLPHLERWWRRLDDHGAALGSAFDAAAIVHSSAASTRVAAWAYDNAVQAGAQAWLRGKDYEQLPAHWRDLVGVPLA